MGKGTNSKIVSNASPLINLSKIGRLDLLEKIYGKIIIPQAVFDELLVKGSDKEGASSIKLLIDTGIIDIHAVMNVELVKAFRKDLDYGESEALALALEIKADLIFLDEKDARDIAGIYNIGKTGFLGILIKAKGMGFISSVKMYLDRVIESGFRLDGELYHRIIKELGEA